MDTSKYDHADGAIVAVSAAVDGNSAVALL
jgi:hypothetical protein